MYIKEMTLRNFRNFKSEKFKFSKESVNTLIGENASGKTNVFYAMRLVLDESLPLNARQLMSSDFFRGLGSAKGHWIIISLKFADLGRSDEDLVLANSALLPGAVSREGNYTFVFRPRKFVRAKLHEISKTITDINLRKITTDHYLSNINIDRDSYEAVAFTRTSVDFSLDHVYERLVGNFEELNFPNPDDEDSAEIGNIKPPYFSLVKEISCTYVKALRNVVADMKYTNSNPLIKLLAKSATNIPDSEKIVQQVKNLNSSISDLNEIRNLSEKIRKTLLKAVGHTYSPSLDISSYLPEEFDELIKSLGLLVEDGTGYIGSGKLEDLSLGGANLIYLALKLYEYEAQLDSEDKIAHFLLIEEPEAHIHTHIKKTLFSNVSNINTQVFISTHSSQISSAAKISAINVLSRKKLHSEVYQPSNGLNTQDLSRIERYLDSVRSTLLFSKGVILVEGEAEQILIPTLIKTVIGISLDELGISLVSMGGTVFKHISGLFHPERLRIHCSILTDRDEAYLSAPTSYANHKHIEHLIAADRDGLQRKNDLDAQISGNTYVSAYYAENTFEAELINANKLNTNNQELFCNVLPLIYTKKSFIDTYATHFRSTDASIRTFYVLKLANKVGKGWFSLLISEKLHSCINIPEYVLHALSNALKGHVTEDIWRKMIHHRLPLYENGGWVLKYNAFCIGRGIDTPEGNSGLFAEFFVNDPVSLLIKEAV